MARMTKVLVSMPPDLVKRLDTEATRRGVSRSELLRVAAGKELPPPKQTIAERREIVRRWKEGVAQIERELGSEPFDSTAFIRADRDHGHSV